MRPSEAAIFTMDTERAAVVSLDISAARLQGYKMKGAALSQVLKKEKNLPGKLKMKDSHSVSGDFVSVIGGRLKFMGMRGPKHYI